VDGGEEEGRKGRERGGWSHLSSRLLLRSEAKFYIPGERIYLEPLGAETVGLMMMISSNEVLEV